MWEKKKKTEEARFLTDQGSCELCIKRRVKETYERFAKIEWKIQRAPEREGTIGAHECIRYTFSVYKFRPMLIFNDCIEFKYECTVNS